MKLEPFTLSGRHIRLEPLTEAHVPDLAAAGQDPQIWIHLLYGQVTTPEAMLGWVREILRRQAAGTDLPFAVIHQASERAIGCTRYMEIELAHKKLEIGGTWYAVAHQRTAANTECKYLLLKHAFEGLGCIRVQLKTDQRNLRSQQAIERLGAVREGVLRNHMITPEGVIRNSVYYSILDTEWPAVKARLEGWLG